jgi:MraZ protein
MFQGAAALSLDTKGRFAIPARHREALASAAGGKLVLTAHPHRCLLFYPEPAWEPIRDKVSGCVELQSAVGGDQAAVGR